MKILQEATTGKRKVAKGVSPGTEHRRTPSPERAASTHNGEGQGWESAHGKPETNPVGTVFVLAKSVRAFLPVYKSSLESCGLPAIMRAGRWVRDSL